MEKEMFGGIGRGYLLAFSSVILTAVMSIIIITTVRGSEKWILEFWKEFIQWFVVPIVAAKEVGKMGQGLIGKIPKK